MSDTCHRENIIRPDISCQIRCDYPSPLPLQTSDEREKLLRQVVVKCREEAVNDILALEARWDDLLNYARQHTSSRAFPNMMRKLRDHFPEACFDLYRQEITDLLNQGADPYAYEQIADYARQLQDIPGHEDAFGQFMSEIIDTSMPVAPV